MENKGFENYSRQFSHFRPTSFLPIRYSVQFELFSLEHQRHDWVISPLVVIVAVLGSGYRVLGKRAARM